MKRFLLVTFSNIINDSRILRYIDILSDKFDLFVIGNGEYENSKCTYFNIDYRGKRKNKSLIDYLSYNYVLKIRLFKIIIKVNPDFIQANDFETLIPVYIYFRNNIKNIIYDSHEIWCERAGCRKSIIHRVINYFEYLAEMFICRKLTHFITVSNSIAEYFSIKYKINSVKVIRNIPSGIVKTHISNTFVDNIFNNKSDKLKFIYLGPLSFERNIPMLIEAFAKTNKSNIHLYLVGKNYLNINFSGFTNISFIDEIPEYAINSVLSQCDIGVHPLKTDLCLNHKYASPNKIYQYMHAGLALMVFSNDETFKIITKHQNGICGSFDTVDNILVIVNKMLNSDISKMKINSLKASDTDYSWENESLKYINLINNL